jgi:hypothetical protein
MLHADRELARRIEMAEAANARGCTPGAVTLEIGGGVAVFAGPESPLTMVVGIGLFGPLKDSELDTIEAFFRSRGAAVNIDLCPLADPGLLSALADRGYRIHDWNNVLITRLAGREPQPAPRVCLAGDAEVWSRVVGQGFFEQSELSEDELKVGRDIFAMPGAHCYVAVAADGEAAGGSAMSIRGGLATLFADGIVARFRRQGLHRELIAARLNDASANGCDLAVASAQPGSTSQRNFERLGFQVAYTKIVLSG